MGVSSKVLTVCAMVTGLLALSGGQAGAAPGRDGVRSALVIGISQHAGGKPTGTVGGAGDAAAVRDALRQAGWRDDEMMVLTDGAATAARIRDGLSWLQRRSTDSSFSVFHYSGHVYQRAGDLDRDGEALDEFIVPYDSTRPMVDRELSERLRAVSGWMWADIAGCEAAGFDEGGLSGPRRLVTTSSAEPEKSYERPDWRMSVFVGLMADQGLLKGMGDTNGDGMVSIQEAFARAAQEAPKMTAGQRTGPQHPQMMGGDGAAWFLRPPAQPPAPPPAAAPRPGSPIPP
ncbi:MAG: caspase family protein, partial [Acidimicrobiales bacterium]